MSFVGSNRFRLYLSGKKLYQYEGKVSCVTSVIAYNLSDQLVYSPLLKTF